MKVSTESISNKEIARAFKLTASLLELHNENPFKVRSMQSAAFRLERLPSPISTMTDEELSSQDGIGKSLLAKIKEYLERNSFDELDKLLEKTPPGVVEMMAIKGIGPKKVSILWKELGVESPGELLYACNENRLVELKGFGTKTQDLIRKSIEYSLSNTGKFLFAPVEGIALQFEKDIKQSGLVTSFSFTGDLRRKCEILEVIELIVCTSDENKFLEFIDSHPLVEKGHSQVNDGLLESKIAGKLPLKIYLSDEERFSNDLFNSTASPLHLEKLENEYGWKANKKFAEESEIYSSIGLPYIDPELREGLFEFDLAKKGKMPELLVHDDLKGILHNHSTYSDGEHSLEEMATYCKELGYEYLGICDHSKSAFYANGLQVDRIEKQHAEIEKLNQKLAPFKIFKGIESDILNDGSLDYPDEILKSFDLIVASVHSVLRMDIEKATKRLITAIENPYTTILGHPTGRLLLAREGYPIDHKKVIDACAANGVIMELNANPYRLDLDWRFIQYALEKNVMISINPDAHRKEGYHDMYYGVCVARKGGLTKEMTFNALSLEKISSHFEGRKK
jgi:DNA polymerase (family 10)